MCVEEISERQTFKVSALSALKCELLLWCTSSLRLSETLAVPAWTFADDHSVASLGARFACSCKLGQVAVDGFGMHVTLALASTTTVGMVNGVHGHTAHLGSDAEMS